MRNYLRVRGEYAAGERQMVLGEELPPRARRIRFKTGGLPHHGGTTSACAENTCELPSVSSAPWNYLRVRGEYCFSTPGCFFAPELPPRARRIPRVISWAVEDGGTTSACAENTVQILLLSQIIWNYLRVRGEYVPTGALK